MKLYRSIFLLVADNNNYEVGRQVQAQLEDKLENVLVYERKGLFLIAKEGRDFNEVITMR